MVKWISILMIFLSSGAMAICPVWSPAKAGQEIAAQQRGERRRLRQA